MTAYNSSTRTFLEGAGFLTAADLQQSRRDILADAPATIYAPLVDPTGAVDSSAAVSAALAAAPGAGSIRVLLPAGNITVGAPIVTGGRNICIEGCGKGLTTIYQTHAGVGITINQTSLFQRVIVRGITFFAAAATACAAALVISHPTAASFPYSTTSLVDVDFNSSTAPPGVGYPDTWTVGAKLIGQWQADVERCNGVGAALIGASHALSGTSLFDVSLSFQVVFDRCSAYTFDCFARQLDYCEGLNFDTCTLVGCNTTLIQDPGITLRAGLSLDGLWSTNCEINNYISGWNVTNVRTGQHAINQVARYGDSGSAGWVGFSYTSCDGITHSANNIDGGGVSPGFATAIGVLLAGACSGITFDISNIIVTCGVGAVFGAGTTQCVLDAGIPAFVSPASTFSDNGTSNQLTYRGTQGIVGFKLQSTPPASSSAPGQPGMISWDGTHIWICVATNTWKSAALT